MNIITKLIAPFTIALALAACSSDADANNLPACDSQVTVETIIGRMNVLGSSPNVNWFIGAHDIRLTTTASGSTYRHCRAVVKMHPTDELPGFENGFDTEFIIEETNAGPVLHIDQDVLNGFTGRTLCRAMPQLRC